MSACGSSIVPSQDWDEIVFLKNHNPRNLKIAATTSKSPLGGVRDNFLDCHPNTP
jgi:hypothetical protein